MTKVGEFETMQQMADRLGTNFSLLRDIALVNFQALSDIVDNYK